MTGSLYVRRPFGIRASPCLVSTSIDWLCIVIYSTGVFTIEPWDLTTQESTYEKYLAYISGRFYHTSHDDDPYRLLMWLHLHIMNVETGTRSDELSVSLLQITWHLLPTPKWYTMNQICGLPMSEKIEPEPNQQSVYLYIHWQLELW